MQYVIDHNYANPVNSYTVKSESVRNPSESFIQLLSGDSYSNDTGVNITQEKAIGSPPVWTSASKICGHLAQMPLDCMKWTNRDAEESEIDRKHPAQYLLNYQFNEFVSADVGKETLALHSLLRGNGRALILRNNRQDAAELIILPPDETVTVFVTEEGSPRKSKWHVWREPGTSKQHVYPDRDVLHIPGLSGDGYSGYDTIKVSGNSIGAGIVAERKTNRFLKNNATPSIMLEAPTGAFTKEADAKEFLEKFRKAHSGENEGTVGMLRNGVKANTLSRTAQESQMIEQRKFSREDMALLFGVEQMLGIDKSVSYNSEEQRSKAYRVNCLGRWMTRWAMECWRKLLSETQKRLDSHFFMWNDEILMQATLAERYEGYSKAISSRILNPNECRKKEGYKPYTGGDKYENPNTNTNAATSKQPATQPEPPVKPATNAIRSRIEHMVGVEKKRLMQIAEKPEKFSKKLEQFYSGWKTNIEQVVSEMGGDSYISAQWLEDSYDRMIELSGKSTKENLLENVRLDVEAWSERVNKLIESIMEVQSA